MKLDMQIQQKERAIHKNQTLCVMSSSNRPKPVFRPRLKPRPKHTSHYTETETEPE